MWVWKKNISKTQEDTWQQRMSAMPGAVFSEGFQAERLNLDVYVETEGEAVLLQKCYGGKLEEVKTVDWVAATAPENTPPLIIRDKIVISIRSESCWFFRQKEHLAPATMPPPPLACACCVTK